MSSSTRLDRAFVPDESLLHRLATVPATDPVRSTGRTVRRDDASPGFGHGKALSMSTAPMTATAAAMRRVAAAGGELRCVLVVEGDSDRGALEILAARLGRDLKAEGVAILPLGGATNLGHLLPEVARAHAHVRVAGLCDADQQGAFRRQLEAAGLGQDLDRDGMEKLGFFVCNADLEDELIRALGIDKVLEVISAQKEHATFETFRKQPAQRGRAVDAQLRRFIGTRSGRKLRYARALVQALDLGSVPRPLAAVLACCAPAARASPTGARCAECAEPHQRGR